MVLNPINTNVNNEVMSIVKKHVGETISVTTTVGTNVTGVLESGPSNIVQVNDNNNIVYVLAEQIVSFSFN